MKDYDWRINLSPSTRNEYRRIWYQKVKNETLEVLGGVCAGCGFDDIRALQIDHVNSDGSKERHITGTSFFYHVQKNVQTGRYQILCANCNAIKRVLLQEVPFRHKDGPNRDKPVLTEKG